MRFTCPYKIKPRLIKECKTADDHLCRRLEENAEYFSLIGKPSHFQMVKTLLEAVKRIESSQQ